MTERNNNDLRADLATAARVDQGLHIYFRHGLHPALEFFEQAGVPRSVALRALCSPDHFRQRDRRKAPRPRACGNALMLSASLAAATRRLPQSR